VPSFLGLCALVFTSKQGALIPTPSLAIYERTVEAPHGHIIHPNPIQVNFFTGLLHAVSPHAADCAKAEDVGTEFHILSSRSASL
jgi:hypothetical protein